MSDPPEEPASPPHPGGRPSKLTPAVQKKICKALRAGVSRQGAAAGAGVAYSTMAEWMARGQGRSEREASDEFVEFAEAVERAEARFEAKAVQAIKAFTAGPDAEWRAAAFLLERRFRDRWGKLVRQEHSGPGGGPIPVSYDIKSLTDEQLERIARGEPPGTPGPGQPGSGGR